MTKIDSTTALKAWQDQVERIAKSRCPKSADGRHDWWPAEDEEVVFCTMCGKEIRRPFKDAGETP